MPVVGKISVTGDKAIDRMFDQLPKRTQNKIFRDELKKVAAVMAADAKNDAPVDEGDLAGSIKHRAGKRTRTGVSRVVLIAREKLDHTRTGFQGGKRRISGGFQEWGTRRHDADPFMTPAFVLNAETQKRKAMTNARAKIIVEARRLGK